jgi:hypothetical protein
LPARTRVLPMSVLMKSGIDTNVNKGADAAAAVGVDGVADSTGAA